MSKGTSIHIEMPCLRSALFIVKIKSVKTERELIQTERNNQFNQWCKDSHTNLLNLELHHHQHTPLVYPWMITASILQSAKIFENDYKPDSYIFINAPENFVKESLQ